jgi:hypothetical protein
MTGPRRWARRAMLSALAGGGLTAAGLGGPLVGGALGAEASAGTSTAAASPPPPVTETTPQASGPTQGAGQPASTTSTTPAPSSVSTTPSAPAPASSPPPPGAPGQAAPTVVVQRRQQTTRGGSTAPNVTETGSKRNPQGASAPGKTGARSTGPTTVPPGTPNGVAGAPQTIGGEAGGLASLFTDSAVSAQALGYYRIPIFLLPIYQAAAIQYDVPWQILAAINEVETNYGTDLSVSTAGAVGWMQFMPQTWLQYGVDATDAGYADPYNPVDAIFAAARYLHAAGASRSLPGAILAYNHSQAYVESVLLRARLISSYPRSAIATLTALVDGRPPTPGARMSSAASLTGSLALGAGAAPAAVTPAIAPSPAAAGASLHATAAGRTARSFAPPPPPQVVARHAEAAANAPAKGRQLVDLLGAVHGPVVAVQDGRIVHLGRSHSLGRYLVLRDIYGDVFTYAGLGDIVPRYRVPEPRPPKVPRIQPREPAPTQPASAGHQPPLTLKVSAHAGRAAASTATIAPVESEAGTAPPGMGRVRLFAHPDNPIARAVAARAARDSAASDSHWRTLQIGSIVSQGTVLGHLDTPPGAHAGHMRFAIRPAGDGAVIDPLPVLSNWRQLNTALHPKGSMGQAILVGATAAPVFQMSKSELERATLSDPGIQIPRCGRREIASGTVDTRVLAALVFLSRSGLQPTVGALRCAHGGSPVAGADAAHHIDYGVDISAINGIPIAGHQGPWTATDTTIRALLTLHGRFAPQRIVSLMRYPEAASTLALPTAWDGIQVGFLARRATTVPIGSAAGVHPAGQAARAPLAVGGDLSPVEWDRLIARIAALPQPTVAAKPSSAAIRDPQAAPTNRGLGVGGLTPGG